MAAAKATAQAATAEAPPVKAGPSMMTQMVMLLVASLLAAGVGSGAGMILGGGSGGEASPAIDHAPAGGGHGEASGGGGGHGGGGHGEGEAAPVPGHEMVIPLAQITTNLAAPSETWIRLEASIVLDEPPEPELADAIHQDLFAFVRTLKMHQIQGPSGFQHLRSELDERASVRSEGKVKRVLIRTLLFE